ncbi:MAG: hypothetical protein J0I31_02770 [Rhizobiales bacterium]|nr:hypothetical protein [Hyphomicrobiales bacterium]
MSTRVAIPDVAPFPPGLLDQRVAQLGIESFESAEDAAERQAAMIARLARYGFDAHAAFLSTTCRGADCAPRTCPAACHFASRFRRAEIIFAESEFFRQAGEDAHFFTVVPSSWRVDHDKLDGFEPKVVASLVAHTLRSQHVVASFNVELILCREDGRTCWVPHIHGLAKGHPHISICDMLEYFTIKSPHYRSVFIRITAPPEIPAVVNYMTKRVDEMKVRYYDEELKRRWRHIPLAGRDQATLDAWRCKQPKDAMHYRVGFKRNGRFLVRT